MQELKTYYPEFEDISHMCKYDNCNHLKEPGCSVREALENGEISQLRYNSYISNLEDIKKKNKY
jgi:ribosome biogenesis GTPase